MTAMSMPGKLLRGGASGDLPAPAGSASASGRARARARRARALRLCLLLAALAALALALAAPPAGLRRAWRRALHWYLRVLHVHPLGARAVSAGVIFCVADLAAQRLAGGGGGAGAVHGGRLARYTLYGTAFMGPFLFVWYSLMNAYGPADDLAGSLQKCLFEQLTLEPFCIVVYIVYDGVLCRRGWRATARKMETALAPLWFKNAVFWMPANFCNYYIGTPDLRVVFANLCSLFWNAYFSTKINIPVATPGKPTARARSQGSGVGKYTKLPAGDSEV